MTLVRSILARDGNASVGYLYVNGHRIPTPVNWLTSPTQFGKVNPWARFKVDGVMVNAYDILSSSQKAKNALEAGLPSFLDYDGPIMMDSGGFLFLRNNRRVADIQELINLYEKFKPDIAVTLDFPFSPNLTSSNRKKLWERTLKNFEFFLQSDISINIMPVLHGSTIKEMKAACKSVKDLTDPRIIGIGS